MAAAEVNLSNGWFVGTGSSLLAGGVISVLSYLLITKKNRRERLQNVDMGNREVIIAVRPGIAEGNIPDSSVLTALTNATARRYGLYPIELFTASQLGEELIKEVMDSTFLSSEQKTKYCTQLTPLLNTPTVAVTKDEQEKPSEKSDRHISAISALLGILTALLSTFVTIPELSERFGNAVTKAKSNPAVPIFIAALFIALGFVVLLLYDYRRIRAERIRIYEQVTEMEKILKEDSSRRLAKKL